MKALRGFVALLAGILLCLPLDLAAQGSPPTPPLPQDQLDGLLAPIALYPDELLTQVLIASTYPLEVVEAARFVKANPSLRGSALDDALRDRTWDASVLSLTAFPQVLDMMNDQLEWTQRLGDAFLSDEAGVMRTVQSLRQRAAQAGNLNSTEQQRVVYQDQAIVIEPAQPDYVYVPVYNPTIIYGPWWAPAYTPWFWYPPPIWGYAPAPPYWGYTAGFFWGAAWAVNRNYWGWAHPNWHNNNVSVNFNNNNYRWADRPQYRDRYPNGTGNWNHSPEHRKGVAYRDQATYNRYRPTNPSAVQSRENYRGNPQRMPTLPAANAGSPSSRPAPSGSVTPAPRPTGPAVADRSQQAAGPGARPPQAQPGTRPAPSPVPPSGTAARPPQGQPTMHLGPTFQTMPRAQVQMESNRGQASRQTMNAPPPSAGRPPSPATGHPQSSGGGHPSSPAGGAAAQGRSR